MQNFRSGAANAPRDADLVIFEDVDGYALLGQASDGKTYVPKGESGWSYGQLPADHAVAMLNLSAISTATVPLRVISYRNAPAAAAEGELEIAVPYDLWSPEAAAVLNDAEVLFTLRDEFPTLRELDAVSLLQTVTPHLRVQRWVDARRRSASGYRDLPAELLQRAADGYTAYLFGGKDAQARAVAPPVHRRPLVEGLVPVGLVLLVGGPFVGKSTIAASLAASVAAGVTWCGRPVAGGPVLVVAGERIEQMRQRCETAFAELANAPGFGPVVLPMPLTLHGEFAGRVFDRIREWLSGMPHARLLILDTLASLTPGLSEQESSGMTTFAGHIKRLTTQHPNLTVLLLHHPTKSGQAVRGHGSLEAAADAVLELTAKRGVRHLVLAQSNTLVQSAELCFKLVDRDDVGLALPSNSRAPSAEVGQRPQDSGMDLAREMLTATLREAESPVTGAALQLATGVGRTTFYTLLKDIPQACRLPGRKATYVWKEEPG